MFNITQVETHKIHYGIILFYKYLSHKKLLSMSGNTAQTETLCYITETLIIRNGITSLSPKQTSA